MTECTRALTAVLAGDVHDKSALPPTTDMMRNAAIGRDGPIAEVNLCRPPAARRLSS